MARPRKRWLAVLLPLALVAGGVGWLLFQKYAVSGWYRADRRPSSPQLYAERFERLALSGASIDCSRLAARDTGPIIVLVHGIGGDRKEMEAIMPVLMAADPAAVFMFRWFPVDARDALATRLADGLSRLAECLPTSQGRLLVLAHSAGGVVASFAASRVHRAGPPAAGPWLTVLTAASPLAGTLARPGNSDGSPQPALVLDLGTRITKYPPAADGVRVVHLRTHADADPIMTPDADWRPNDPTVGVPGAPQIDLPDGLDHDGALLYVATEVAAGRWTQWRDAPPDSWPPPRP